MQFAYGPLGNSVDDEDTFCDGRFFTSVAEPQHT